MEQELEEYIIWLRLKREMHGIVDNHLLLEYEDKIVALLRERDLLWIERWN